MVDYYIAFWNVENLFDAVDYPHRTDKLQRTLAGELAGWTASIRNQKIHQLASIIQQMNGGNGPDILGVCEVENNNVLNLLVNQIHIPHRNYNIAHHDMSDERGIDVAFIYDQNQFIAQEQFSHYIVKRVATRDLFQVNFRSTAANNLLVLIGNHWPSRSGGQYESEAYRIIAGETLAYFHQRIREVHDNNVAVMAVGDFNDEPFNRSIVEHALGEKTRTKVTRARSPKFLNLMWSSLGSGIGTHYFDNNPNILDQFLVSKGLLTGRSNFSVRENTTEIIRFPEMINTGIYPVPIKFGRGNTLNRNGFSDHFPIGIQIRE